MEQERIYIANAVLGAMGLNGSFEEPPDVSEDADLAVVRRARAVRKTIPFMVRAKVMARDGFKCVQCASVLDLEIDHRRPVSKGGSDDEANLQTLCGQCNRAKSDAWGDGA
jgi:5-methylcytosine-specific restriction endonuclease McrA